MRAILAFLFIIAFIYPSPPKWYISNTIAYEKYEYIGYGEGENQAQAKQNAKADISSSIQTKVKSSLIVDKTSSDDGFSKKVQSRIEEISDVELDNLMVVKSAYIDGVYYVALKYINLPFAKKIRLRFGDVSKMKKENNKYLLSTFLLKELKNEFGFYPKVVINKGNLIISNESFKINKDMLKKLFLTSFNDNIELDLPKILKNKEFYFINIHNKKSGYITLIQIYENGETSILFTNKKVNKNTQLQYPNKDEYDGLEAYLENKQYKAKDLTIALLCSKKKDFSYFDNISIHKEKFAKVYGKIFDKMNGCDVSSRIVYIQN